MLNKILFFNFFVSEAENEDEKSKDNEMEVVKNEIN